MERSGCKTRPLSSNLICNIFQRRAERYSSLIRRGWLARTVNPIEPEFHGKMDGPFNLLAPNDARLAAYISQSSSFYSPSRLHPVAARRARVANDPSYLAPMDSYGR